MTKTRKSRRARLLSRVSTACALMTMGAAFVPVTSWAQETVQEEDEEIVVTGTRIAQPDFEFSNPIASADAETIERSGVTNVTEFVQDMPALMSSFDSYDSADTENSGTQGLNLLDLRGLGTARTLVLVDGRRHVAGNEGSAAVDVNSIPVGLIERVEVLTGGASAIYGADGVTGVVNFIMRDDYEGISGRFQYGSSTEGGADDFFGSILAGRNFDNGRGNITFSYEYSETQELNTRDRDYATPGIRETLIEDPFGGPYTNTFLRDIRYIDTSPGGSFATDDDGIYISGDDDPGEDGIVGTSDDVLTGMDFIGDGSPFVQGTLTGDFGMQGGSGSLLDAFVDQLLPGLDRQTLSLRGHYDLNNSHTVFGDVKWAHTETLFEGQVTYDFGAPVFTDNPYMPDSIRDAATAGPFGDFAYMFRDNFDLGSTFQDIERNTYRTVIGLRGDITPAISYEVSNVWGQTRTEQRYHTRNDERWFAGIDVVDLGSGPQCREDTGFLTFDPGECVPINVFGDGSVSDEAIAFAMTDLTHQITISQWVTNAYLSGDTSEWFELPAGPIGFAVGTEYREEESEYDHDDVAESLPEDTFWNGQGVDSFGRYSVFELFGEVEVPILRDLPFAEELLFDAAYRYSDYTTVGETDTYKFGLRWRPAEWLMIRGTQARAVRAPNITELFQPTQPTFAELEDPCDDTNVNLGTEFRFANCQAALTELNAINPVVPTDPNSFNNTSSDSIEGLTQGNRDLDAETADTTTYGFVLEPPFLPGFALSVDYWDIELADAIEFFEAQTIVDYCYDLPQPNQYCDLIVRSPSTPPGTTIPPGGISGFTTQAVNVSSFEASGIDFGVRYRLDPADFGIERDIGQFQFAVNATHLTDFTYTESEISPPDEQVDDPYLPEWQAVLDVTWILGNFTLNYGYSWYSETERFDENEIAGDPTIVDPAYFNYSERSVHDIYAAYDFGRVTLYGGVNNFTNQEPDRGDFGYPVSPLGRFAFIGAKAEF